MDNSILEAKRRHGDDVPIRDAFPTPEEISDHKSFLERVSSAFGGEEWMWKSNKGKLLAIIVIPAGVFSVADFWGGLARTTIEYAHPYIQTIAQLELPTRPELVLFSEQQDPSQNWDPRKAALIAPRVRSPEKPVKDLTELYNFRLWRIARHYEQPSGALPEFLFRESDEAAAQKHLDYAMRSPGYRAGALTRWYTPEVSAGMLYAAADPLIAIDEMGRYEELATAHGIRSGDKKYLLYEIIVTGSVEHAPLSFESYQPDWSRTQQFGNDWIKSGRTDMLSMGSDFGGDSGMFLLNTRLMSNRIQLGSALHI